MHLTKWVLFLCWPVVAAVLVGAVCLYALAMWPVILLCHVERNWNGKLSLVSPQPERE